MYNTEGVEKMKNKDAFKTNTRKIIFKNHYVQI